MKQWTPNSSWTLDEWMRETRALREALTILGAPLARCLPGEPLDCGRSVWEHYATYAGMLKGVAHIKAECNLGDGPGMDLAERAYTDQLAAHRH
ncbi:hypothetical protein GCM10009678_46970 [Actinomadura kijaniata]|uniref:Uncharacterized protein n=1 Tax=Actinomadura namibiensis TaxID=182080 RepID=A0A7W3QKI5_ACTNM|nr:hypothetical protein [Actinomadura namibiensis]MBA8949993.1 hypothetical protein [Actinomadura namibiensis]